MNKVGIILTYHRVADLEHDPWQLGVSPRRFEEQMQVLKKYGRPVQMREIGETLNHFSLGQRKVVVTFDDGYADNFQNARPILQKYGIPATFFITTGAINSREEFWWDEIGRLTLAASRVPDTFEMTIKGTHYRWLINSEDKETVSENQLLADGILPNGTTLSKKRFYYILWQILNRLSGEERKTVLKEIAQWAGQSSEARPDHLPMTSEELKSLASDKLFEIGAHTVCHPMLSRLSEREQEKEIVRSKQDLEDILDRPVASFAYPHGDYTEETVKMVKKNKFKYACTVTPKRIAKNSDPFRLSRFGVSNWSGDQFEEKIKKWLS